MNETDKKLKNIRDQIINLKSSPLYQHRIDNHFVPVVGEGNHNAEIMFIAEAPGYYEAKSGRHFQGKSGSIFDQLISYINIEKKDVYITNIVKDKLPDNRNPTYVEIQFYSPFLLEQIKIIKPAILVTLGKISSDYILSLCNIKFSGLKNEHGESYQTKCSYGICTILPTFHPAVGLYNPDFIPTMKNDFAKIITILNSIK